MSKKEVREIEVRTKVTGVEESERKLKKLKTATREQEMALNRLTRASKSAQVGMSKALGEMAPKNISKAEKRVRGIQRAIEYESIPKKIGYKQTNKFAQRGFVGSVGSGPKRQSVIRKAVDRGVIIGANQKVNVRKFDDYAKRVHTRLLQGPEYSMPDGLLSLTNKSPSRRVVSQEIADRIRENVKRSRESRLASRKQSYGYTSGQRIGALGSSIRKGTYLDSAYSQNKEFDKKRASYNKDWAEAIKQNAKFDSDNLKSRQRAQKAKEVKESQEARKAQRAKEAQRKFQESRQRTSRKDSFIPSVIPEKERYMPSTGPIQHIRTMRRKVEIPGLNRMDMLKDYTNKASKAIGVLGQSILGAVSKFMLFASAITMVSFMAKSAFASMMTLGDKFSSVEGEMIVGAGFREQLIKEGGVANVAQFDRALETHRRISGLDQATGGAQLARAGSRIRESGGVANQQGLEAFSKLSKGASALTGKTFEAIQDAVMNVATEGKGAEKLGLKKDLRLRGSINDKLGQLLDAMQDNSISRTAIENRDISASMQMIRSSPNQLMKGVFQGHRKQATGIFAGVGDAFRKASEDTEVIDKWSRVLTNLQEAVSKVFSDEKVKEMFLGMAQWSAEFIEMGAHLVRWATWILSNSGLVINGLKTVAKVYFLHKVWKNFSDSIMDGVGIIKDSYGAMKDVWKFSRTGAKYASKGFKTMIGGASKLKQGIVGASKFLIGTKDAIVVAGDVAGGARKSVGLIGGMFEKIGWLGKIINVANIGALAGTLAIMKIYQDYNKGKQWARASEKVEEWQAGIGFALGGSGKGLGGALEGAGKGALAGMSIGAIAGPVGMAIGTAIGSIVGAVLGYIGGEKISMWVQKQTDFVKQDWQQAKEIVNGSWNSMMDVFTSISESIIDTWTKVIEWFSGKIATLKEKFGMKSGEEITDSQGRVYNRDLRKFETAEEILNRTPGVRDLMRGDGSTANNQQPALANHWNNPNATYLVLNGDVTIDNKVGATQEQFISTAGY